MRDLAVAGEAGIGMRVHGGPPNDLSAVVREHSWRRILTDQLLHESPSFGTAQRKVLL